MTMKSLFDILIDQIVKTEKEKAKEEANRLKSKKADTPTPEEPNTAEEQAAAEVKRRAEKRLKEAMKKQDEKIDNLLSKQKRSVRALQKEEKEKIKVDAYRASLTAPTARLQWESIGRNMHHLRGSLNGEPAFEIKLGLATFKLYLMDPKLKEGVSIKKRAEKAKIGNIHSSSNVYVLKQKAEKLILRIEAFEQKNS